MNGAASVSAVELFATHDAFSEAVFYNSEILLCHTPAEELSTSFEANYAGNTPMTVFKDDTLSIDWTAPGWNGFTFDPAFDYNGLDNLIIEFRYLGEDGRTINARAFYPPTPCRTLDGDLPSASTGELLGFMNSVRIYYTPATGIGGTGPGDSLRLAFEATPAPSPVFLVTMPENGAAALDLFSLDGRVVWSWSSSYAPRGIRTVSGAPAGLVPGIYIARLSACGRTATARFVAIR